MLIPFLNAIKKYWNPKKINNINNMIILNLKIKIISFSEKMFLRRKIVKIVFKEQITKKIFVIVFSVLTKLKVSINSKITNNK